MTAPHVTKPYHLSNHFKRDDRPGKCDRIRTDDGRWHFVSRTVFNAAGMIVLNLMEYQDAPVPSIVDGPRPGTVELRFGEVVSVVVATEESDPWHVEVTHRHGAIRFGIATGWDAEFPGRTAYVVSDLFDAWHRVSEADYEKLIRASKANPTGTPGIPFDGGFAKDKLAICFGDARVEVPGSRLRRPDRQRAV